jgi:hypothetical protein
MNWIRHLESISYNSTLGLSADLHVCVPGNLEGTVKLRPHLSYSLSGDTKMSHKEGVV